MTNDQIKDALNASATLMRILANGHKSPQEVAERLRHWAGKLEITRDELSNRDAATRTLVDTFKNWQTGQEHGYIQG